LVHHVRRKDFSTRFRIVLVERGGAANAGARTDKKKPRGGVYNALRGNFPDEVR